MCYYNDDDHVDNYDRPSDYWGARTNVDYFHCGLVEVSSVKYEFLEDEP